MQGNPYIMGLITQAGVIITAILSFITALVQLHSNKKAKDSDKTLVALTFIIIYYFYFLVKLFFNFYCW